LDAVAKTEKTNIDAISLVVLLDQAWVDEVPSGAATVRHLHANIAFRDVELGNKSGQLLHNLRRTPAQYRVTRRKPIGN
jgi:hypothetical protein